MAVQDSISANQISPAHNTNFKQWVYSTLLIIVGCHGIERWTVGTRCGLQELPDSCTVLGVMVGAGGCSMAAGAVACLRLMRSLTQLSIKTHDHHRSI